MPQHGESPGERLLEGDVGGEPQLGDAELRLNRGRGGEPDMRSADLGGELNRMDRGWRVPPERSVMGTEGLLSVGEELQRLRDNSLRGRRLSSRSLMVRMWWDLGGAVPAENVK